MMADTSILALDAVRLQCRLRLGKPLTFEKVAALLFQFARKKIDLSDRPTSRSRTPVKGERTPKNLATETDSDFFNSIECGAAARKVTWRRLRAAASGKRPRPLPSWYVLHSFLTDTLQPGAYLSNIGFPRPIQPAHRFQNASGPLFDIGAQCLDSIIEG